MARLLAVSLLCLLFSPRLHAQISATLYGSVTDSRGSALQGARIAAGPSGGPPSAQAVSGADGRYRISLPAGRSTLVVTRASFAPVERQLDLQPGESREMNISMLLAPLSSRVEVTGQSTPEEVNTAPEQVTILTREQIEQSASISLPVLLETQPGFSLAQTGRGGGLTSLFLDGGNSNHTKVLVDGTTVNDSGGAMDYSNMTLVNVDKIEIVHGAASALYGSDAMDGVIQVFTRRGTTREPELDLTGEGGTFGTGNGEADLSGLLGRFDYSAAYAYFSTDGQGPNDFFVNRTYSGNFGWSFSEGNSLRLALRANSSDAGLPGQTLFGPPDLTQHYSRQDFTSNLSWNGRAGPHWSWTLSGSDSTPRWVDNDSPNFVSTSQYNLAAFNSQASYQTGTVTATAGYALEVENGFPSGLVGEHAHRFDQAGFLEALWRPLRRLNLQAGVRAEDNGSFGTRVVPRLGASYLLRESQGPWGDTRLRGYYSQGIVAPRLDQSFGNDPCFPGNPSLSPEQSRTASFGVEQALASNRVRVSADYFYTELHDVISFAFLAPTAGCMFGTGTYFNTDLAIARGARATVETHPARWLSLAGSYIYDNTRVLRAPNAFDPTMLPGNHLFHRPVHSGSLAMNFSARRLEANVTGYFTGIRTDSDFLGLGLTHAPGYARFDSTVSFRVQARATLFLRASNLFDKQYQDVLGFPAFGREVRGGVRLRIGGRS
ncbi:MAG TPA: TonB-dependent receptor [Candidatus Acidoferrales bacterium]|nr:TonB-dependent receptor [Candidatus Acidoferrales bacterium]